MNNRLDILANTQTLLVINAADLRDLIHEDRELAFAKGMAAAASQFENETDLLTKQQVAEMLQCSVGAIDYKRRQGDIESIDFDNQVRFTRSEVARYIRLHKNIHKTYKNNL